MVRYFISYVAITNSGVHFNNDIIDSESEETLTLEEVYDIEEGYKTVENCDNVTLLGIYKIGD